MLLRNDSLKTNKNFYPNSNEVKYIVVHYTGYFAPIKNFALNQKNNDLSNAGSAHEFVNDSEWYLSIDHCHGAWAVGDNQGYGVYPNGITNYNSLNIEMCCCDESLNVSEKTKKNTAEIVAYYMKQYNVPIERVVRHYDATYKQCPLDMAPNNPYVKGEENWKQFKKWVLEYFNENDNGNIQEDIEYVEGVYDMKGKINLRTMYRDGKATVTSEWYNMDESTTNDYKNIYGIEIYTDEPLTWSVQSAGEWITKKGSGKIIFDSPITAIKIKHDNKKVYYWVSSPGDVAGYKWWENACKTNYGVAQCQNTQGAPLNALKIRLG